MKKKTTDSFAFFLALMKPSKRKPDPKREAFEKRLLDSIPKGAAQPGGIAWN